MTRNTHILALNKLEKTTPSEEVINDNTYCWMKSTVAEIQKNG